MNLIEIFTRFPSQQACIEHLEQKRWNDSPSCPHCNSNCVARKNDGDRVGRWNCHECKSSFNVLSGTIFEKSSTPLQKWFLLVGLMVNAKKSLSCYQVSRDLDIPKSTAIRMQHKIRAQMASDEQEIVLQGIIEADETYIGGKPRKGRDTDNKRGRGTRKQAVIGAVERNGKVVAQVAQSLTGRNIMRFITDTVDTAGSLLITDEFASYRAMSRVMPHAWIDHKTQYADGDTHTNTIEGVWSLIKRAWYGSHHHYSRHWMPLYIAESCWKYNHRKSANAFGDFVRGLFA